MRSMIDFSYAFGTPHRITVALPDSSDKTLLDCHPDHLWIGWSYEDLTDRPLAALMAPRTGWRVRVWPEVDGRALRATGWTRRAAEGDAAPLGRALPVLEQTFTSDEGVTVTLEVAGALSAALCRVTVHNPTGTAQHIALVCTSLDWGETPAWLDADIPADHMLCGWAERADRVMALTLGADSTPIRTDALGKTLAMAWDVPPGGTRSGWLVRPYRAYAADLPALRGHDWAGEFDSAVAIWNDLLGRMMRVHIPDAGVVQALYACLADFFIMREPVADGYIAGVPGTEGYRAPNAAEPGLLAIGLDQFGLHDEAAEGYQMELDQQGDDGNWADPKGWGHTWWSCSGFKARAIMEHYYTTGDRAYLERIYPRMLASSRFQERQRARSRRLVDGVRPPEYGLMPRGFGDCGLWDGDDRYGVFFPHNVWATYADGLTLAAAEELGRTEDIPEVRRIYETALQDLRIALEAGAIPEEGGDGAPGYRWIPGAANKRSGSRWGALNTLAPCGILPPDHPLIEGTLRFVESRLSEGGQPVHTGWMEDGMWVAITLDNVAQAHLARGEGDPAAAYLISTLNHGTPLHTWCEERGQEPGSTETAGDIQHLFTPVAVVRCLRDVLVMERGDTLHLALGTPREWLASGEPVGVDDAPTRFGRVTYSIRYDAEAGVVRGEVAFPKEAPSAAGTARTLREAILHLRLPGATETVRWEAPRGRRTFEARVSG